MPTFVTAADLDAVRRKARHMPVQNAELAAMFDQAAELLEIQGEN